MESRLLPIMLGGDGCKSCRLRIGGSKAQDTDAQALLAPGKIVRTLSAARLRCACRARRARACWSAACVTWRLEASCCAKPRKARLRGCCCATRGRAAAGYVRMRAADSVRGRSTHCQCRRHGETAQRCRQCGKGGQAVPRPPPSFRTASAARAAWLRAAERPRGSAAG